VHDGKWFLVPENENYPPIPIHDEPSFEVWGVVTNVIHPL
jgi:DNA polymerase V